MATSVVFPRAQFFSNNGRPLIGGRIHTYAAGSSTRTATYRDAAKSQPNTNPILLDARGEAAIYLAEGVEYKFVLEDASGSLILTQEPVYGAVWPNAAEWPSDTTLSYQYMTEAKAVADATSAAEFFDTYAQALSAAGGARRLVEIARDETLSGARTRYWAEGGALEFSVNLDQVRMDLSSTDDPGKGAGMVGFVQKGTGAQPRTLESKSRDIVCSFDFMTKAEIENIQSRIGTIDVTAKLQKAIDAIKPYAPFKSNGLTIYNPPGVFRVGTSESLNMSGAHGVHFTGAGKNATELLNVGNRPAIYAVGSATEPLNKSSVSAMVIRGPGRSNSEAHGIFLQWTNHCAIKDVMFLSNRRAAHIAQAWQLELENTIVTGSGGDQNHTGYYLAESSAQYPDNAVKAKHAYAQYCFEDGFRLINCQGSGFENCEAGGCGRYGYFIGSPEVGNLQNEWAMFTNCFADSCGADGWILRSGNSPYVGFMGFSNCWSGNNGQRGWYIEGGKSISIDGGINTGNSLGGITFSSSLGCTLLGMILKDNNETNSFDVGDITLVNSSRITVSGNNSSSIYTNGKSLVESGASDYNAICGNNFDQSASIVGANTIASRNVGYKTEARGDDVVPAGSTSRTMSHNLPFTPNIENFVVNLQAPVVAYVSLVTPSQFLVRFSAPLASDAAIKWSYQHCTA